ncbi:MAG TPA: NAD-dependent epimerase/dehydratase family protein, partial [Dehalococcoidia bacterium]|nr:NAD-dependent epimerase/dehydratase family protein [Dehalococcoidia bacterium]
MPAKGYRVFVTGGTGVLGRGLIPLLRDAGHDVVAPGRTELDLTGKLLRQLRNFGLGDRLGNLDPLQLCRIGARCVADGDGISLLCR